ncbi:copper homeostasis protein CutC [Paenibacillus puldeungensis]|uniref:PF03932 family protein CutC n=1 Tax=Paenibacillus puldeungensis TaxID=696536 RepID=A0ABW3RYA0_9BACL
MILEVIATCVEDAVIAEANGADRLELITAMTEGGLTPGIGLVQQVTRAVKIPVNVMVRPHSRSFVYGKADLQTMVAEVQAIRRTKATGIVIGMLTANHTIDEAALKKVLSAASGLDVTFHRAFDELEDQIAGIRTLQQYPQISRVLTSGGPRPAPDAIPEIGELVQEAARGTSLRILAGHGLTLDTVEDVIMQTGVDEVHFGSAVRLGGSGLAPIDPERLKTLADRLHKNG